MESLNGSQCRCSDNLENDSEMENRKNESSKNTEENLEGSKSDKTEHVIDQEQNSEGCEIESKVDIVKEINLYAHGFDIFREDFLKVENAWPDLYPYEKTEEISVKELKSLELKGIITKYFKLDLSNEFIVIKVTSDNNILVNAVKYKESDTKHTFSAKSKPIDNSSASYDSVKANGAAAAVVNLMSNDQGFQGENTFSNAYVLLEETDIKKEESSLSSERTIDSFESSASGNDLHATDTEIINDGFTIAEINKDGFTKIESAQGGIDFESDDIKSIASKDEEVDCAPTRVRTLKPIPGLTKDTLNVPSLYSIKTSFIGKYFSKQKLGSNSTTK